MEMKNIFIFNFSKNHQFTSPNRQRNFFPSNELQCSRVMADRHMSAEWYLFGGCNILVVATFRIAIKPDFILHY
jgi:hypothetical protein